MPAIDAHGIGEYLCTHYILLAHGRAYRLYENYFKPIHQGLFFKLLWLGYLTIGKYSSTDKDEMYFILKLVY